MSDLPDRVVRLAVGGARPAAVARAGRALGAEPTAAQVVAQLERGLAPVERTRVARAWQQLGRLGAEVTVAEQAGYPPRLARAWPDLGAPLWLFVRSDAGLTDSVAVAVVGTRQPSLDGLATARTLGARLARAGVTVVSGLARGIDQAAHQGALEAGGRTIAVLGTGLGVDYPRGLQRLRREIAGCGALVTEYLPGAPARAHHFLERNRIVSGLADAVVVVEGRARSGALATAQRAAEQGRQVLACPGSVNALTSQAPLALIRDGAAVVTQVDDVLEAVGAVALGEVPPPREPPANLSATARDVETLLSATPAAIDALARATGRPAHQVLAAVAELMTLGLAAHGPAGVVRA